MTHYNKQYQEQNIDNPVSRWYFICTTENLTLPSARRLAAHMTHDVMFGGLAVPQMMHSSLLASRRLACGTFCG